MTKSIRDAIDAAGWTETRSLHIHDTNALVISRPHPAGGTSSVFVTEGGYSSVDIIETIAERLDSAPAASDRATDMLRVLEFLHARFTPMTFQPQIRGATERSDGYEIHASDRAGLDIRLAIPDHDRVGAVLAKLSGEISRQRASGDARMTEAEARGQIIDRAAAVLIARLVPDIDAALDLVTMPIDPPRVATITQDLKVRLKTPTSVRQISKATTIHATLGRMSVRHKLDGLHLDGCTIHVDGIGVPDTVTNGLADLRLDDVVRHPLLEGGGLVVERAWKATGPKLLVRLRPDPIPLSAFASLHRDMHHAG